MPAVSSSEPAWEAAPAFGRRETILATLQRLYRLRPGPGCIVETGTLRNHSEPGCSGDGWSTVAWGWYSVQTGGRVYTVDVDAHALAVCRQVTAPYRAAIAYVQADSVAFLQQWKPVRRGRIHLLYLDSLDYLDRAASEAHNRAGAEAALPHLAAPCLVLIDDTEPVGGAAPLPESAWTGKGAQTVPFLLAQGFEIEWAREGQVLLCREPGGP